MDEHPLALGERIEVRDRYQRGWHAGFELAGVADDGYRVRRLSDGQVLGRVLRFEDVQRLRPQLAAH